MVYQDTENGCGKAVVRELLFLLTKKSESNTVPLSSECDNFYLIREELNHYGQEYSSYEIEDINLLNKKQLPSIAQIDNFGKTHFVIVTSIHKNFVTLYDPQFGNYNLNKVEFLKVFLHKMLVRKSVVKLKKIPIVNLMKKKDILGYFFCYLFQSISLMLLLFSTSKTGGFILSVMSATFILIGVILQNVLNAFLRNKLDMDVLLPFYDKTKNKEDFNDLSFVLNGKISLMSKCVSYSVVLTGLIVLLVLNDYFYCILVLVSILFSFFQIPLERHRNVVNRYCTIQENDYFNLIDQDHDSALNAFKKAKQRATNFISEYIMIWTIQTLFSAIFIIVELHLIGQLDINVFLYYIGLTLGMNLSISKISTALKEEDGMIAKINHLSYSLSMFLMKR